ncbi:glycoside hydrolase family 20 protein [Xylariaceae sp. FL1272]|nr:glycoside hydrolase family 20 protein [Xylariaceae sp. FL1272]
MLKGLLFWSVTTIVAGLQILPPPSNTTLTSGSGLSLNTITPTIYITSSLASERDTDGLTLIPPSGKDFAETFLSDLNQASSQTWTLKIVDTLPDAEGIYLDVHNDTSSFTYANGESTSEGYTLSVSSSGAHITGSGARGMFWGTRTLLQFHVTANATSTIPSQSIGDVPAYATRGFMLDAGRKWYSPSFLKELCSYASFYKLSEFHYHTSDNYPLNRGHNESWNEVYSQFSLHPENDALLGIVQRPNETLSRADFEDLQSHCASRGVTVVPEIEAPGHCLSITKWKPELALPTKKDLLNLTHPDSIPTVKAIWTEFLPWFQTKEIHIGADEYDSTLADDYIHFVNEMSDWVNSTSGKKVRIWGTYEPPSTPDLAISKDVVIQHWQYGQSDPVQLSTDGYGFLNTEDWWAYMSLKNDHMPILPAPYPQFFNETRVLNFGGQSDWQWSPELVNFQNLTEQVSPDVKGLKGAFLAAWNDNGPDASTQLEAYYAIRRGIPLVGARSWSGSAGPELDTTSLESSIDFLAPLAPAQNLDRHIPGSGKLISWTRNTTSEDEVKLGYGSKGMNYTLTLFVTGPFILSSSDTQLVFSPSGELSFIADGWTYPLRSVSENDGFEPGLPGRIWANATTSSHEVVVLDSAKPQELTITGDVIGGTRVYVDGEFKGRFEVYVFGGKNTVFSWSQMAFVAPLESVKGSVTKLGLWDGVKVPMGGSGNGTVVPGTGAAATVCQGAIGSMLWLWVGLLSPVIIW